MTPEQIAALAERIVALWYDGSDADFHEREDLRALILREALAEQDKRLRVRVGDALLWKDKAEQDYARLLADFRWLAAQLYQEMEDSPWRIYSTSSSLNTTSTSPPGWRRRSRSDDTRRPGNEFLIHARWCDEHRIDSDVRDTKCEPRRG